MHEWMKSDITTGVTSHVDSYSECSPQIFFAIIFVFGIPVGTAISSKSNLTVPKILVQVTSCGEHVMYA